MTQKKNISKWILLGSGIVLFISLIILFIVEFNTIEEDNKLFIFKLIELLISGGAAITFTLSFSISFDIKNTKNQIKSGTESLNISGSNPDLKGPFFMNNKNCNFYLTQQVGPGMQEIASYYQNILMPWETDNMKEIAEKTYIEMSKEPNNNEISKEFVLKYIEDSKGISDSEIQDIWVKLLLQESSKAKSVSRRTLNIVKDMDSEEAKIFNTIAALSILDDIIPDCFGENYYDFDSITLLQDLGLVKSNDMVTYTMDLKPGLNRCYGNGSKVLLMINKDNKMVHFETGCHVLTLEGHQLKEALSIKMTDEEIVFLGKEFKNKNKNKNIDIQVYNVVASNEDGETYDSSKGLI